MISDKNTSTHKTDQSRKRGTLESDLLLSTFAAKSLPTMTPAQMRQYDLFLDENDWDIYYWATQPESPAAATGATLQSSEPYLSSQGSADEGGSGSGSVLQQQQQQQQQQDQKGEMTTKQHQPVSPAKGEWAQTVGTFRPAYRPVPTRWKGSEILELLRQHVKARSAAGVLGNGEGRDKAEGMAFMPPLGERK